MGRRYTSSSYLRRLEGLAPEFNLTSDVIVGFPGEDEAAFGRTLATVVEAGLTRIHVFPYSPRPATGTAGVDPVTPAEKKERGARLRELSRTLERRRWESKLGSSELVLVDRPGRGYGDDYTPYLLDAPVGELVAARAVALDAEGIVGLAA
jgi:threonylcarbamoyladenosine tRNA methylthiotransferase MtaB